MIKSSDPAFSNHRIPGTSIDLKCHHGYVVGPGSVYDGGTYTIVGDEPIADFPEELVKWATSKPDRPQRQRGKFRGRPSREVLHNRRAGLLRSVREAEDGSLNSTLYWSSCRAGEMISDGLWDEDRATCALEMAALEANLEEWRILPTIDSGISTGMGQS